uniref:Tify domain-containing protein n=1 Tax=Kalanchoe fedtschenkoi TaxID=63787 RepID=A0A7N0UCL0_KALFE
MESKRSQQWFTDNAEADLFPHKKQAVEVQSSPSFLGIPNSNVAQWGNSGFHTVTGQFTERLFAADSIRTINFDDRHVTSTDCGNINVGRKNTDDPFGDDSSFGLSISHTVNDPKSGVNYSGIRKVKVSQVKDSDSILPMSMGQAFMNGDPHAINVAQAYSKPDVNSIPTDLPFGKSHGDTDILSAGNAFHQENNNFISMGQPFNKGSGISIHQDYRPNDNTVSMNPSFGTGVSTIMPVFQIYTKGQDTGITNYPTSTDNLTLRGHPYSKENESQIQLSHDMFNEDETSVPGANSYKKENNILMGNLYNKGDSNILPFGNYEDEANTGGRVICNYDLVMGQPPVEKPTAVTHDETAKHLADVAGSAHQVASESGTPPKKKDSKTNKKDPPNSFPSNVRSLLSTGILDGVPVKYVAWSREELHGVIKGTGYLCGCQSCNRSKVINAYEFERHAGCKTKHPNNHIYFENGKTVYGIVQELKSTPQNMLFDVIQTITGSPINQKSFRLWKESFLAATRELQRIYGKDEVKRLP